MICTLLCMNEVTHLEFRRGGAQQRNLHHQSPREANPAWARWGWHGQYNDDAPGQDEPIGSTNLRHQGLI